MKSHIINVQVYLFIETTQKKLKESLKIVKIGFKISELLI